MAKNKIKSINRKQKPQKILKPYKFTLNPYFEIKIKIKILSKTQSDFG